MNAHSTVEYLTDADKTTVRTGRQTAVFHGENASAAVQIAMLQQRIDEQQVEIKRLEAAAPTRYGECSHGIGPVHGRPGLEVSDCCGMEVEAFSALRQRNVTAQT
jgi:hypothetical protein